MREETIKTILEKKLVAIVRGFGEDQIVPLAQALMEGGISCIEVTFNQKDPSSFPETARAITALRTKCSGAVTAGAGTVLTLEQLRMAESAGAAYIVTPNVDPQIIGKARELNLVTLPGAYTASECVAADQAGADFIKLFPAGIAGPGYLAALRAPLSHLRFLAVGGITLHNIEDFLRAGALGFGVGGNLVSKDLAEKGAFDKITALAKEYTAAAAGSVIL